ncbi:hypothetical protein GOV11_03600, partial [Candidatus Woesearchaeota archaeon]|nr:hypothetical protein [Candidatus Woesearchaeota archaeon]
IGRVRARKLISNGIRTLGDVKKAEFTTLRQLIGPGVAKNIKDQVGVKVSPEDLKVRPRKRKGQISLEDFKAGK